VARIAAAVRDAAQAHAGTLEDDLQVLVVRRAAADTAGADTAGEEAAGHEAAGRYTAGDEAAGKDTAPVQRTVR
jgi:hypothetical protein